jgi:serine phosphatase RsbU (regulator of sigma subunit)
VDRLDRRSVASDLSDQRGETAARSRAAVSLYVAIVAAAGFVCLALTARDAAAFPAGLAAFILLAAVVDLREVRLPGVGDVTMSFVLILASLVVFGLFPALLVALVSGFGTLWLTRDPQKVIFNAGNYVLSTFLAAQFYLGLLPVDPGITGRVLPAFAATGVDFLASTVILAGVVSVATGESALRIWQVNYQWGLPSYLTGASLSLLVAGLYLALGLPGLLLALPPLFLIYYSYEIYASRARDRQSHSAELASFKEELLASTQLHEQIAEARRKVAAEIERARQIQLDLLPKESPEVEGLEFASRIEFMTEMGGDYYDFIDFDDGHLAIVCGDVMGKGLAAALIMAMARSLLHQAAHAQRSPGRVLAEVNDGLARDLKGQALPSFLTLTYAVYEPARRRLTVAGGGHNPLLVFSEDGERRLAARGSLLGVRPGLDFPEDTLKLRPGDLVALYTDGVTEARNAGGELFGVERLSTLLRGVRALPPEAILEAVLSELADFRGGTPPADDLTLLLIRAT